MNKYEAIVRSIEILTARLHNQSIRHCPDFNLMRSLQRQLGKLTDSLLVERGDNED